MLAHQSTCPPAPMNIHKLNNIFNPQRIALIGVGRLVAEGGTLKKIVAQTTTDNKRMISGFQKRGFDVKINNHDSTVAVSKKINNN